MPKIPDIRGNTNGSFKLGINGPHIRANGVFVEARDVGDTFLTNFNCGDLYVGGNKITFGVACRVYHSVDQAIASGVATVLAFNSERYDTASLHSTSSNTSRLTAPTSGYYHIGACVAIEGNASGSNRQILLRVNGTTTIALMRVAPIATAVATVLVVSADYFLSAGEYVEVLVQQNSGSSLNVQALANYSPEFWIHLIN